MPEGPSVRRWGDIARQFLHKRIKEVKGVSKVMDRERWRGAFINNVIVYGKQLFFQLLKSSPSEPDVKVSDEKETSSRRKTKDPCGDKEKNDDAREDTIWYRYHFLMWGSLRANEYKEPSKRSKRAKKMENPKAPNPMVEFHFDDESFLVFYGGSILVVDGPCEDEGTDVLSDTFDVEKAATALRQPVPICYTLMDQTHFAGAGNIVKNEVLYASRMHPLELGSNLTEAKAVQIAKEVVRFTTAWLKWEDESSKYQKFSDLMKMYWKFKCPDGHKTMRGFFGEHLKRMTTWCPECQALRVESEIAKSELENIGKIKKTTRVKRENEGESEDDDGDENIKHKQKKKVKLAKDKSDVVIKKTVRKSTNLKYEDDEDFGQKLPSSKARKSSVAKGQKKGKSPAIKRKTREKRSVESVSAEKVASKNKSRKRTRSDVNRADVDDGASVENKKGKFMKKSMRTLRSRVKIGNQDTEDDKSIEVEIFRKLPTTSKDRSEIEETCSVRVRNKGKIRSCSVQPDNVSIVSVGKRTIIKEESNPSSESSSTTPTENELVKKESVVTEEKDVSKRRSSRLRKSVNL